MILRVLGFEVSLKVRGYVLVSDPGKSAEFPGSEKFQKSSASGLCCIDVIQCRLGVCESVFEITKYLLN